MVLSCVDCRSPLPPRARFCPECGRRQPEGASAHAEPARDEWRQLTVMFCDLVDSTELSVRLGAEDYRRVVRPYHEACTRIVAQLGGMVVQRQGDGILVYFGYPRAHEDAAERGVQAGLSILQEMQHINARIQREVEGIGANPLRVRIGIHTGPVVVTELGAGDSHERLAVGTTVNAASRMQQAAARDSVVVSDATRALLAERFELEELGAIPLKGLAHPVLLHRVRRARSAADARAAGRRWHTPLVGREKALEVLLHHWGLASVGRGCTVVLKGEAGVGKSRLASVLQERLLEDAASWVELRSSPHHQNTVLYPVVEQIERGFFASGDSPEERTRRLARGLGNAGLDVDEALPLLTQLLDLPPPEGVSPPELPPEERRRRTLDLLAKWMLGLSQVQPLGLLVEDLQWADPTTLELLEILAGRIATHPLLLVVTHRPDFQWAGPRSAEPLELTLGPLDPSETRELMQAIAGAGRLTEEVVHAVEERSEGVPLYVEELTRFVLEATPKAEAAGALSIPPTLQDSFMARLDRLGDAKDLAQLASVIGRQFDRVLLEALHAPHPFPQDQLEQLLSAQMIYEQDAPENSYAFKHALLRDAAYQSLLRSRRIQIHRHIADVLERDFPSTVEQAPELLGYHREGAEQIEQAVACWQRAGQRALAGSAHLEAERHFRHGVELLGSLPGSRERSQLELDLSLPLGLSIIATRGYSAPQVDETFRRARTLCDELGDTPLCVLYGIWVVHLVRGDLEATDQLAPLLARFTGPGRDPHHLVVAHSALGCREFFLGHHAKALEHEKISIRSFDPADHAVLARTYGGDVWANAFLYRVWALWCSGWPERAASAYAEVSELVERAAHPFATAARGAFGLALHQHLRDVDAVERIAEAQVRLCAEQHFPFYGSQAECALGWVAAQRGRIDEGVAQIRRGLSIYVAAGARASYPYWLSVLVEAHLLGARLEEGLGVIEQAISVATASLDRFYLPELHRLRGELRLRQGEAADAQADFERALAGARRDGALSLALRAATSLARLWRGQGEGARARELLGGVYASFQEGFDSPDLRDAQALLAALPD